MTPERNSDSHVRGVDERLQQIIDAMIQRGSFSLWNLHALMTADPDSTTVSDVVERGLHGSLRGQRAWKGGLHGGPFQILPAALLLCRWRDALPGEAVSRIHELFTAGILQRGNTENHWLMYYAGNLLAAEAWMDVPLFWNGLPPATVHAEARRWILGMIDRTARLGHHEYDSTAYQIEHLIPYIGLADHARDAKVRAQAQRMATLLVADMALEYFHGAWAGGHAREGYRQNTWTRVGPVQGLQYAYFGGVDFDSQEHCNAYIGPALTASFRPPAVLAAMAADRDTPHAVLKTKSPRTIYRHVEREARPVRKYTYMSRSFALGSTQTGLPGPPAGPIDLVSWDLSWNGANHDAKIVCNHPYRSPGRFSAFLSDLPQSVGRGVGSSKPYLQRADRLFGASPYEQMMQHEGCIIILYDIPADDEAPFVNLYLPRGPVWHERHGWLLANMDGFYVALRPLGPYRWLRIREGDRSSIMVTAPNLIDGWLLRLPGRRTGLVLDAAEASAHASFDAFAARRLDAGLDLEGWPDGGRVGVQSVNGGHLEMTYNGPHRLDGQAIDYESWPLYSAPGVEAFLGTGRVAFRHGKEELVLDFGVDPQASLMPMRVIG